MNIFSNTTFILWKKVFKWNNFYYLWNIYQNYNLYDFWILTNIFELFYRKFFIEICFDWFDDNLLIIKWNSYFQWIFPGYLLGDLNGYIIITSVASHRIIRIMYGNLYKSKNYWKINYFKIKSIVCHNKRVHQIIGRNV